METLQADTKCKLAQVHSCRQPLILFSSISPLHIIHAHSLALGSSGAITVAIWRLNCQGHTSSSFPFQPLPLPRDTHSDQHIHTHIYIYVFLCATQTNTLTDKGNIRHMAWASTDRNRERESDVDPADTHTYTHTASHTWTKEGWSATGKREKERGKQSELKKDIRQSWAQCRGCLSRGMDTIQSWHKTKTPRCTPDEIRCC